MPIKFTTKVSLPIGADPKKLAAIGLGFACGVIVPLSAGGDTANQALADWLGKASKFEKKLQQKCALEFTKGVPDFKKMAKTYLSNRRCLLVALFEHNRKQPLDCRMTLAELEALSEHSNILKSLSEPAKIWAEQKSSGNGERVICAFGPLAGAAQRMVRKMLRLTYQPQVFQYLKIGSAQKVELAMNLIKQKGYTHALEIDIKAFFPSFTEEDLIAVLPLPPEAVRHIIMAKTAAWTPWYSHTTKSYILSPPGMPQGSVSSAEVALWCVAQLVMKKMKGVVLIIHADNFFILAQSQELLKDASNALSAAISALPGGDFLGEIKQKGEIAPGFRMLGCNIWREKKGHLVVEPSETNYKKMNARVQRHCQKAHALLTKADVEGHADCRIHGLQEYLRLESVCTGWMAAFGFCGPHLDAVANDHADLLAEIRQTYDIKDSELSPLKDASTAVQIKWYSSA
ncbi:MAG: reverse transcriptase domain-containing protein [Pseudorhodobacter sp.]